MSGKVLAFLAVPRDKGPMGADDHRLGRRGELRQELHAEVELLEPRPGRGMVLNASDGGLRIAMDEGLSPGTWCVLRLTFDDGAKVVLRGRIAWASRRIDGCLLGVELLKDDAGDDPGELRPETTLVLAPAALPTRRVEPSPFTDPPRADRTMVISADRISGLPTALPDRTVLVRLQDLPLPPLRADATDPEIEVPVDCDGDDDLDIDIVVVLDEAEERALEEADYEADLFVLTPEAPPEPTGIVPEESGFVQLPERRRLMLSPFAETPAPPRVRHR
jgi:hypothetical protein